MYCNQKKNRIITKGKQPITERGTRKKREKTWDNFVSNL